MKSRDVKIWQIKVNKLARNRKSFTVRWSVAGLPFSKTFATRGLAENDRSDLLQAANKGEAFDRASGLPDSMVETPEGQTWLSFVLDYVAMKWPGAAAKSRDSTSDALSTVSAVLVRDLPARPDATLLRRALRTLVVPGGAKAPDVDESVMVAWRWLERASVPLVDLVEPVVIRSGLDALNLRSDGKAAAATTMRRKRSVFYNVLQYAVELNKLPYNPIDKVRVRSRRKKVVGTVDRRVVVSLIQARELLVAVSYVGTRDRGDRLAAFFACLYFAALRPAEALGLRDHNCYLPLKGWGKLTLEKSRPQASKRWTDSGEVHDERGLKHRGEDEPRVVPIPPELVRILWGHIARFGVGPDGRIFVSTHGNPIAGASYSRVWAAARRLALTPRQVASPLAARPYDLRHAAVSLWLNSGVPAVEVAERAGHSVDVLLRVYAKCIDGQEATVNSRLDEVYGSEEDEDDV